MTLKVKVIGLAMVKQTFTGTIFTANLMDIALLEQFQTFIIFMIRMCVTLNQGQCN